MEINLGRYEILEFDYYYKNLGDSNIFIFFEDLQKDFIIDKKAIYTAKVYLKIPSWYELHEISRLSSKEDIYTKERTQIPEEIKNNKLKMLLWKIEDSSGEVFYFTKENINQLHPELASFLLGKINGLIEREGCNESLNDDEARTLAYDCQKYYKSLKNKKLGKKDHSPTPPAIVVLRNICEMFNCLPDDAKKISRRDIDEILISVNQENITEGN